MKKRAFSNSFAEHVKKETKSIQCHDFLLYTTHPIFAKAQRSAYFYPNFLAIFYSNSLHISVGSDSIQ